MSTLPAPILAHPRLSQWLSFVEPGVIIVRSGRVELGQGVSAALISIAATEFQIDKERIKLVSGDTECCPNEGFTAGSVSISVGGLSLRIASRISLHLLKERAATVLQASASQIEIVQGTILQDGVDTGLTLWDQAEAMNWEYSIPEDAPAALIDASRFPPSAYPHNAKQSFPPNDLIKRLAGQAFIHDFELPDMLHARVVSPLNYRARLIISIEELSKCLPPQVTVLNRNSFVAVVSTREEQVVAATNKLNTLTLWSADERTENVLTQNHPLEGVPFDTSVDYQSGDAPIQTDGKTLSVQVERPCLSHASIGPGCAIAQYRNNKLTIWTHSQGVFPLRTAIASMLELEPSAVRVIHMPGAGCYGHNSADDVAADAAIAAMIKPGVPIRMQYSRADEFQKSPVGPAMRTVCVAELDDQNHLASIQVNITSPAHSSRPGTNGAINLRSAMLIQNSAIAFDHSSTQSNDESRAQSRAKSEFEIQSSLIELGEPPLNVGGGCNRNAVPAYRIPEVDVVVNRLSQLTYRVSALRGLGAFINVLSIESMMDACAELKAGVSPVDYRLQHLDDPRARAVITAAADMAGYERDNTLGVGYARDTNTAAYCACIARVSIDEQIKVEQMWIVADAGENINPDGIRAQLEGGAIQAMSWLLQEAAPIAGYATRISDWESYPIARFSDIPELHAELIEPESTLPLGCGEASQGPAAAAIYNAACRVLGTRPDQLPLSRDGLMSQLLNKSG